MARADSGVIPVRQVGFDEVVEKFWGRQPNEREWELIFKRIELLQWLDSIHPDHLEIQAQDVKGNFTKLFRFGDNKMYAPAVYYRILPNELVFDVDGDSVQESFEVTKKLVKLLKTLNCKPAVGFSGNRGFHVHVITTAQGVDPKTFAELVNIKEWRDALFMLILDLLPEIQDYIDIGVVTAKAHTIRAFYSVNLKSGKWKTFVKPCRGYAIWEVSGNLGKRVMQKLREDKEIEEILKYTDEFERSEKNMKFGKAYTKEELLREVMSLLENAKDRGYYIVASCPFHPPDRHPSLVIYKNTGLVIDFHTNERMSLRSFVRRLGKLED